MQNITMKSSINGVTAYELNNVIVKFVTNDGNEIVTLHCVSEMRIHENCCDNSTTYLVAFDHATCYSAMRIEINTPSIESDYVYLNVIV